MRSPQVISVTTAIVLSLVAMGCESGGDNAELRFSSHVLLFTSSDRVVLEDVSLARGEILFRVARRPLNDQCGRLIVVDFEGNLETIANDIVMPISGPVNGNFAAFSPTGEDVAYVKNGCELGPWSLQVLTPDAPPNNLLDSVGVILGWTRESDLIVSRPPADGQERGLWQLVPRTGDVAEITSFRAGASSDASTLVLLESPGRFALRTGSETISVAGLPTSAGSDGSEFSPDGSQYLYYATSQDGQSRDLAVVNIREGTQQVILPDAESTGQLPAGVVAWAPNGDVVLVQGWNTSDAYLLGVASGERVLVPLEVIANKVFWRGPVLFYGSSDAVWAAFFDASSEIGQGGSNLREQLNAAFSNPLDLDTN